MKAACVLFLILVAAIEQEDPNACLNTFMESPGFGSEWTRVKLNFYELEERSFGELHKLSEAATRSLLACWATLGCFFQRWLIQCNLRKFA